MNYQIRYAKDNILHVMNRTFSSEEEYEDFVYALYSDKQISQIWIRDAFGQVQLNWKRQSNESEVI